MSSSIQASRAVADEQPAITIVNLDAETSPSTFRVHHADVSAPSTLTKLGQFLESEGAVIVNVSMSPHHLCVVTTLKNGWVDRFQSQVQA